MKKSVSMILVAILLLMSIGVGIPEAFAATKPEKTRAIAFVFDNSGTMYLGNEDSRKTWCRATYAMQVLATMMNPSDIMQIYPMNPIQIGDSNEPSESDVYTRERPLVIKNENASMIHEICTPHAGDTHIEAVSLAREGLAKVDADEKWLIVLTDGTVFYRNGKELSEAESIRQLTDEFNASVSQVNAMYLGIGSEAQSGFEVNGAYQFVERKATTSAEVLSNLTELGNIIFGRDELQVDSGNISFDISMKKLIVFVQGEAIDNVQLSNLAPVSTNKLQYSTYGAKNYKEKMMTDPALQGIMLTFEDLDVGSYRISFSGEASDIAVYYEPDVDLDFVFTNANGSDVDIETLYEDEYIVGFGMKDAKTGELTSSELLGNPHYEGNYYINGEAFSISHDGYSGAIPVTLNVNDSFESVLTVTYLSGYTITKGTTDFGWPSGGIKVIYRPAGELKLEISGGDEEYPLQSLEYGKPYIAKVYYHGEQLTGSELESVDLNWDPHRSNALIEKQLAEDHWELSLHYRDSENPKDTACGECAVDIKAYYSEQGSAQAEANGTLTYNITEDLSLPEMELIVPQKEIVIKELESSSPIEARIMLNGEPLTAEEFERLQLDVDSSIEYEVTPNAEDSSYSIKLLVTEQITKGVYPICATAKYTDLAGRETEVSETAEVKLRSLPVWMQMLLYLLLLLILAFIIWMIMRIRVLPKYMHTSRKLSTMSFDGDDVTNSANFQAEIKRRGAKIQSQYAGVKFGVAMDVAPGKESYLYKMQKRRSAEVKATSVKKFGTAKIQEVMIGSAKYIADENSGKLVPALPNQKPFLLTNGTMVKFSGSIQDAGIDKDFVVRSKLSFTKK